MVTVPYTAYVNRREEHALYLAELHVTYMRSVRATLTYDLGRWCWNTKRARESPFVW